MNKENAEFLKERLFFLGFGDKLNAELEKKMQAGEEKFKLPMLAEFSKGDKKDVVEFSIDFGKSKQNDMYFLNSYRATLAKPDPEQERSQTFYINKGKGITAKEAYNLLDGRAVHKELTNKEGQPYDAWLMLNAKKEENGNHKVQQYHSAWGFDVEKSLLKHPIKELKDAAGTAELVKSMQKGNLQPVTFARNGEEEKMYIEASPKDRTINVYNEGMQKQFQGVREHKGQGEKIQESNSKNTEDKKADTKEKMNEEPGERKAKGRKASV
ncbi:hypothetical protein [Chryseolinea lacunae]|uniref:DUF3945 domain-containing protein n=1 Tax=Chryseolinea lacunae TaxID=2801331 RepID=A0ABS1KZI0_9BACT|nr:hypothetical protein [Chryseolinea lacunae]MBL0744869.1 hypothetical protein [Chryseolinea lacunae]